MWPLASRSGCWLCPSVSPSPSPLVCFLPSQPMSHPPWLTEAPGVSHHMITCQLPWWWSQLSVWLDLLLFTERYFIPVSCFLLFNLCDWAGRSLTVVCMWVSIISHVENMLNVDLLFFNPQTHQTVFPLHPPYLMCPAVCVMSAAREGQQVTSCDDHESSGVHPALHVV